MLERGPGWLHNHNHLHFDNAEQKGTRSVHSITSKLFIPDWLHLRLCEFAYTTADQRNRLCRTTCDQNSTYLFLAAQTKHPGLCRSFPTLQNLQGYNIHDAALDQVLQSAHYLEMRRSLIGPSKPRFMGHAVDRPGPSSSNLLFAELLARSGFSILGWFACRWSSLLLGSFAPNFEIKSSKHGSKLNSIFFIFFVLKQSRPGALCITGRGSGIGRICITYLWSLTMTFINWMSLVLFNCIKLWLAH
jgi:hypothetical protein